MDCKIHNKPRSMDCSRCSDAMCPMCAEYIGGSWFCPKCAAIERRIAEGLHDLDYYDLMAAGLGDVAVGDDFGDIDIGEV